MLPKYGHLNIVVTTNTSATPELRNEIPFLQVEVGSAAKFAVEWVKCCKTEAKTSWGNVALKKGHIKLNKVWCDVHDEEDRLLHVNQTMSIECILQLKAKFNVLHIFIRANDD